MTIQDLGSIGELIGAIGVLITLIYLAYQIRQNTVQIEQNTRSSRASAIGSSANSLRHTRQAVFEDRELSVLFMTGLRDPKGLDEVEAFRFRLMIQSITESIWDVYSQTVDSDLAPDSWETIGISLIERILCTPGGRWYWETYGMTYPAAFRKTVDEILDAEASG